MALPSSIHQFIAAVRHVRKVLNILFLVAVVLILCIEFWWKHLPPMFGWRDAHEGAELAKDFLLSYIASYIFFFVGDHWEESAKKRAMHRAVLLRLSLILQAGTRLQRTINQLKMEHLGAKENDLPTQEDWMLLFADMYDGHQKGNETTSHLKRFFASVNQFCAQIEEPCAMLRGQLSDYDSELIPLADDIHNTSRKMSLCTAEINSDVMGQYGKREVPMFAPELAQRMVLFQLDIGAIAKYCTEVPDKDHHLLFALDQWEKESGALWVRVNLN